MLSVEQCRSAKNIADLKELQYKFLFAKLGFDTGENEPSKVGRFLIGVGAFITSGSSREDRSCGRATGCVQLATVYQVKEKNKFEGQAKELET